MTAERFRQIRHVFEAALEHKDADRPAWLDQACQGEPSLRAEVDALLGQYEKRSGVLDGVAVAAQAVVPVSRLEGRRIGAWEILREIGRGGMSVVYLARRADGAFQMQAAVKVLNTQFGDEEIRRRFQQERDILAHLDHPHIARLLDGGTTGEGLPYLVMEYVEGLPLTEWCDARKASVEERVRLMEQICEVVHYLHEHHVIHRDLKPTNVLVNEAGNVKLLDFGISKLLEPVMGQTILATQSGLHLLTPEYASPEQVRGERVTPQTDVYALGVILYELLTGRRPYRLRSRVMHEVVRAICEDEPERPSAVVVKPDESVDPTTSSRLRQASPERLSLLLRGALDEIVIKALCKAPEQRYRTARQLAEDLAAHIQGKPVLARGDSWIASPLQALNRHRLAMALIAVITVLFASGTVTFHAQGTGYCVGALAVVGLCYASTDRKLGRRLASSASVLLTVTLSVWSTTAFFFWEKRSDPALVDLVLEAVTGVWALYQVGIVVVWMRRERWAGELIMDASLPAGVSHVRIIFCVLYLFLAVTTDWMEHRISLSFLVIVTASQWPIFNKREFRQRGILADGYLIPWEKIESWGWEKRRTAPGEKAEVVDPSRGAPKFVGRSEIHAAEPAVLKIERREFTHFRPTRIKVPRSKVADITRVMNHYLSEWPV